MLLLLLLSGDATAKSDKLQLTLSNSLNFLMGKVLVRCILIGTVHPHLKNSQIFSR